MAYVVSGYREVVDAPPCPYCGGRHYALEDDDDPVTLKIRCWCGATARVRRDDPNLNHWPGADQSPPHNF